MKRRPRKKPICCISLHPSSLLRQGKYMRIVIAGGGTGGHLLPGIAIAEEFVKRDKRTKVLFIGTERGIESKILGRAGYELCTIDIEGIKGRRITALVKGLYQIPQSMWQSWKILKQFSPEMVIGVGGYASGPAVMSAYFMGIPTAIAEQNIIPGMTNKILGKFVDRIFLTYADTAKIFSPAKVIVSGNPVRAAFKGVRNLAKRKKNRFMLLIFGGSQGAVAINKNVVEMLPLLQSVKDKLHILHQAGAKEMESVKAAYDSYGISADVTDFIMDMADAYRQADLIICRAGATSLAEITAAGKAPILIPFPYAIYDHQTKNARVLADAGAAVMVNEKELTGDKLFEVVQELLINREKLHLMEENSAKLGKINAAATITKACLKLINKKINGFEHTNLKEEMFDNGNR
jgi:UDP-N-acetylglucosamine--N-acetylmuramyl-(pentapeptide) pyrophosphoryl-undecaprenol N-acetylglucosamine transferase